jgi:serine protease AprX
MRIRIAAVLLFMVAMIASVQSKDYGLQKGQQEFHAKIAPWVLERTSDGKQAEFLVVLADQADLSGAASLRTKEEKGRFVYETLWNLAQQTQKPLLGWLTDRQIEHRPYYIVNMIWVKGDLDVALNLAARPDVARIEGNPEIRNFPEQLAEEAGPIQEPSAVELGIINTRAPQVWALGITGQGVVVGGADTGYRWDHNAIKGKYRGWNGTTANHDSIHAGGGSCGPNASAPCDDNGHGTHTMGTVAGDDGGTNQVGMAPGAKWIGCRNMNQGVGTPATYIECFEFFLAPYPVSGTPAQGDPTKAPHVTANSWGCPASEGCSANTLLQAVEANRAAGIMTVVAAGNAGSACSTVNDPPAIYDASYSVGALQTGTDSIASFSSRGPVSLDGSFRTKPDISAPGTSVRSSSRTSVSSYSVLSGTSMACPHVAGATALLLSADPSLRGQVTNTEGHFNDTAVRILSSTCSSSGIPNNVFGFGRLDVKAAVDLALTAISPLSLAFSSGGSSGSILVDAPSTVSWEAMTSDNWIIITSGSGTGDGEVNFEVRDNFNERFRTGTITVARKTFTVHQAGTGGVECSYSITPAAQSFAGAGGAGNFTVVTSSECIWTALTADKWIKFTSETSGIGTATVTFSVDSNPTSVSRKGFVNVQGQVYTVKQKGS